MMLEKQLRDAKGRKVSLILRRLVDLHQLQVVHLLAFVSKSSKSFVFYADSDVKTESTDLLATESVVVINKRHAV